jgi:ADP-ribose pyrophosphatase YjhB (NUDIX family)
VERGETLVDAVGREVREECGLTVEVHSPPLALVESISPDGGAHRHVVHVIFAASAPEAAEPASNDPAVRELAWFGGAELNGIVMHPPIGDLLQRWLSTFAHGLPADWPPLESTGIRWTD